MSLRFLQENWEQLGKVDPLWAVLTYSDKKDGKWEIGEFFKTGEEEIDALMQESNLHHKQRETALDFGCGVGRLTQALAKYFHKVVGIDIAPSMIKLAETYNRHPEICDFFVNKNVKLDRFPDAYFDFIYSSITFQHMRKCYTKSYLKEFMRILKPGGLVVFQLPSHLIHSSLTKRIKQWLRGNLPTWIMRLRAKGKPWMDMNAMPKDEMIRFLEGQSARMVEVVQDTKAGDYWQSFRYTFTK